MDKITIINIVYLITNRIFFIRYSKILNENHFLTKPNTLLISRQNNESLKTAKIIYEIKEIVFDEVKLIKTDGGYFFPPNKSVDSSRDFGGVVRTISTRRFIERAVFRAFPVNLEPLLSV